MTHLIPRSRAGEVAVPPAGHDLEKLRRSCEAAVAALAMTVPFDHVAFTAALAGSRGRPIHLHPHHSPPGPCGLWIALDDADHVYYDATTTPLHRQHIVLHELGHVVCDHRGSGPGGEWVRRLMPGLNPAMVARVLGRSVYGDEEEVEAEMFASVVVERATRLERSHRVAWREEEDEIVGRLRVDLTHASRAAH